MPSSLLSPDTRMSVVLPSAVPRSSDHLKRKGGGAVAAVLC